MAVGRGETIRGDFIMQHDENSYANQTVKRRSFMNCLNQGIVKKILRNELSLKPLVQSHERI